MGRGWGEIGMSRGRRNHSQDILCVGGEAINKRRKKKKKTKV